MKCLVFENIKLVDSVSLRVPVFYRLWTNGLFGDNWNIHDRTERLEQYYRISKYISDYEAKEGDIVDFIIRFEFSRAATLPSSISVRLQKSLVEELLFGACDWSSSF